MSRPIYTNNLFDPVQTLEQTVTVYDTPFTVESKGMYYRPASPTSSFGSGITFSSATQSAMTTHFDNNTTPGITDSNGTEIQGRIPLVYDYWGNQTPVGVTTPRRACIRIKGFVKNTGNYGLFVLGRGTIKVFHEGTSILYNEFTETNPTHTSLTSFTAGDEIEIFYWSVGQPWGGLAIRVFDDDTFLPTGSSDYTGYDWTYARETEILSASWMDSNETVTSTALDVKNIRTDIRPTQVSQTVVTLPAANQDHELGWRWNPSTKTLINVSTSDEIKIGQLIKITAGVVGETNPIFAGNVADVFVQNDEVVIECTSFEDRLTDQFNENYPDKISYAAFGYIERVGRAEPVWDLPAYDHWPYEHAIKDMLARAWIDSSLTTANKQMLRVGETTAEDGEPLFRAKSLSGDLIKIDRQPNYGNPNARPDLPQDDPYLTPSEVTTTLYNRITNLVDRIGYAFYTDPEGNFVLRPRNGPTSLEDITDGTTTTHPSAIGGQYSAYSGGAWSYTSPAIKASRIDLVVGIGSGLGTIDVDISRAEDSFTDSFTIDLSNDEDIYYYDQILTVDLTNVTAYTILSGAEYGTYTVTITPNTGTDFRLDALRIFETDPSTPISSLTLTNLENVVQLVGQSNFTEKVNDAIVTGAAKTSQSISDSSLEQVQRDYVTSRATDVHSILDPTSDNYYGRKITGFLSDDSVGSQDLADWISRTLVSRYRAPDPNLQIDHTILPVLEPGDPLYIQDAKYDSVDSSVVYWVVGFSHEITPNSATTKINVTPFPESPSYEPREEVDISLFNNKPAINVAIEYPTVMDNTITNPGADLAEESTLERVNTTINNDGSYYLTIPSHTISPGTELLQIPEISQSTSNSNFEYPALRYIKNNPYQKFYVASGTRLNLPFEMADGSSAYNVAGWGLSAGDSAEFTYHQITDPYTGNSPFYDPYFSELNPAELIKVDFDALVSGYYRISIVDARQGNNPIRVAWLTNPDTTEESGDAHWTYIPAGADKEYFWDGIDNIGNWNLKHTEDYSWRQSGNFVEDEDVQIGRGFYCANDQTTSMTHISDETEGGEVVYPVGKFSQFFVKIEYMRDSQEDILTVNSNTSSDLRDSSNSSLAERYIYYHLPQPNRATISIEDWDISAGSYDPDNPTDNWTTLDNDATLREDKPVRISINVEKRKGSKFPDNSFSKVIVSRSVQLSALFQDVSALLYGTNWNERSSGERKKRLLTRRFNNDDHHVIFRNSSFVSGDNVNDWVFYPSLFEKKFQGEDTESLSYLDYTQITEVPNWNPQRRVGEDRSRHMIAYMAYLFYLSVYTQDKSGRLVWAIDDTFVDKSKILNNTDTTEFPADLERHQRRTIYTRQWWDRDEIHNTYSTAPYNFPTAGQLWYGFYNDRLSYFSRTASDENYPLANTTSYYSGNLETGHRDPLNDPVYDEGAIDIFESLDKTAIDRDLGNSSSFSEFGNWTWENDGLFWIPNLTRDFHPYYIIPPMELMGRIRTFVVAEFPAFVEFWPGTANSLFGGGRIDEAEHDSWFSIAEDYNGDPSTFDFHFRPGYNVEDVYDDSPVPANVIQVQKQDDIKHYENCRGGFTNSAGFNRDLVNIAGGDPYYLNTKLYKHFRFEHEPLNNDNVLLNYNDMWHKGFFHMTFRHTYNWESASLFPVDRYKFPLSGAIDRDKTNSPVVPDGFDPGGYVGWKDDHPSSMQQGIWRETGTCSGLHWRNGYTNRHGSLGFEFTSDAGSSCSIDDPSSADTNETLQHTYNTDKNIFLQSNVYPTYFIFWTNNLNHRITRQPLAVGPRLPQTRRVLFGLALANTRRTTPI